MSEFLRVERKGPLATIWIDRQPKMNTMTVAMRNELPGIFQVLEWLRVERVPGRPVIVVRGAGGKAFSAGGDVAEFLTLAPADLELWGDTLTAAERCRKPVIAAINVEAVVIFAIVFGIVPLLTVLERKLIEAEALGGAANANSPVAEIIRRISPRTREINEQAPQS